MYLHCLVADGRGVGILISQHKAMRLALVASREDCNLIRRGEQAYQVLHMRGLARAPHGKIAYADGGDIHFMGG